MRPRIPRTVVHYSRQDPRTTQGGVESFARNLALIFETVEFMTPATRDEERVRRERLPVICDNHMVLDWPEAITVVGFQHGVAWKKLRVTRSAHDLGLALGQLRAARRRNVLWVACAGWIANAFNRISRCPSQRVIYHPVDLERFDGRLANAGSRLLLHDARSEHKGQRLIAALSERLPAYRFEPLACSTLEVPDRMREARAFLHLSSYEGNSIVCNEAMAMNLPCLFSRVGLMLDIDQRLDVTVVDADRTPSGIERLADDLQRFLTELEHRTFRPRDWVIANANLDQARSAWASVLTEFDACFGAQARP